MITYEPLTLITYSGTVGTQSHGTMPVSVYIVYKPVWVPDSLPLVWATWDKP